MSEISTDKQAEKRVGDLFGGHAELYAKARPTYPSELFEYIATLCSAREKVWDCAAGTGQATFELAKYFKHVEATDINAKQIDTAKISSSDLTNVNFSVQSAEQTQFPEHSFDLVTVAQALHWFEYDKFWPELKRVLKPGGLFAAWGYNWTRTDFHVNHMLEKDLFDVLTPFWSEKAKILWDAYPSDIIHFPFKRIDTQKFSIKMHWNLAQVISYFRSWSSTQAAIKAWGSDEKFQHAVQDVIAVWGEPEKVRIIEFPLHLCFGYNE